jgi:hypothetical protein
MAASFPAVVAAGLALVILITTRNFDSAAEILDSSWPGSRGSSSSLFCNRSFCR